MYKKVNTRGDAAWLLGMGTDVASHRRARIVRQTVILGKGPGAPDDDVIGAPARMGRQSI
jgi:hypothetical protein